MKLFILAAGIGTRLWPLTKNTPKSLISLGDGTTLLERQITGVITSGLYNEIIISTGYKAEQIDAKIKDYQQDIKITTIYNPFYDVSNNLVSLWIAHYRMIEDDFMISNGDNLYNDGVYGKVLTDSKEVIQLTISYKEKYDEDDMKVNLDDMKNVIRVHKDIPINEADAESVGLVLVKGERCRTIYMNKVLQLVREKAYLDKFWLETFNALLKDGINIKTAEIDRNSWKEVDFHPDIDIIRKSLLNNTT